VPSYPPATAVGKDRLLHLFSRNPGPQSLPQHKHLTVGPSSHCVSSSVQLWYRLHTT